MSIGRLLHANAVISDKIILMGGKSNPVVTISLVEIYDPAKNEWFQAAPMLQPRMNFNAGALNDYVYVLGGSNESSQFIPEIERYSITRNNWERVNNKSLFL